MDFLKPYIRKQRKKYNIWLRVISVIRGLFFMFVWFVGLVMVRVEFLSSPVINLCKNTGLDADFHLESWFEKA